MRYFITFFCLVVPVLGEIKKSNFRGLRSDPKVVYTDQITQEPVLFKVKEARQIFVTKNGKRSLGTLKAGSVCELVGFDHRAFQIKAQAKHGKVSGWVSPFALESEDPNFIENFKKLYERELLVRELIKNEEIAIGMSPDEVERVMGKPTKTKLRRTAEGDSGTYEYLETEEKKHYNYHRDPRTGQRYKTYSHTTEEVSERVAVEFENDAVIAIEKDEDNRIRGRRPRIVTRPIFIDWACFR